MKQKRVFLICGIPGSGKSTWVKERIAKYGGHHISRDEIRFALLNDTDEYFKQEDKEYYKYLRYIDEQKKILHKILEDMSGLSETAEKHIEKRNNLRKSLETEQDKETKLIQKQAPLEAELSAKKKQIEEANERIKAANDRYAAAKVSKKKH
jgi:dephospho-CoA kinase